VSGINGANGTDYPEAEAVEAVPLIAPTCPSPAWGASQYLLKGWQLRLAKRLPRCAPCPELETCALSTDSAPGVTRRLPLRWPGRARLAGDSGDHVHRALE
jgi:hypothetical protein